MNNNNYNRNSDRSDANARCWYCNKMGHRAKDCRKKKRYQERREKENANGMIANHKDKKTEETNPKCEEDFCMMAVTTNMINKNRS